MYFTITRLKAIVGILFLTTIGLLGQDGNSEPWEKGLNERQPPDIVLKVIGVKPGMIIGEIGAGRGRYTVFLANATGKTGKVLANDIDEASLAFLKGRCKRLGINNVETVVGEMDNPLFPDNSLDIAIMVLVYHMIENPDNLLINLKKSLKPGSKLVILDPHDKEIDREFGIDRSKTELKVPTIKERVQNSAKAAGYEVVQVNTTLSHDYIFILEPYLKAHKKSTGELIQKTLLQDGIEASIKLFNKIKNDTAQYDLSEKVFSILGYELIGAKSFPEALATLNMGIELFPKSSKLYGEIGEVYVLTGDKEKARNYYKLYLDNGPDSLNAKTIMQNFDMMYEQMRPQD